MCKGIGAPTRTDNNLTPSQLPYGLTHYVENDKLGFVSMELNIVIKDLDYDIIGESENYAFELQEKQAQAELKAKAKADKIKADKEKRLAKLKEKELALAEWHHRGALPAKDDGLTLTREMIHIFDEGREPK